MNHVNRYSEPDLINLIERHERQGLGQFDDQAMEMDCLKIVVNLIRFNKNMDALYPEVMPIPNNIYTRRDLEEECETRIEEIEEEAREEAYKEGFDEAKEEFEEATKEAYKDGYDAGYEDALNITER